MAVLRVFALSVILAALSFSAGAGTVQTVRFAQTGKVLVWMDGVMIGQGSEVSLSPSQIHESPIFGNGVLEPAQTAGHRLIVKIASNTGFVLETRTPREIGEISVRVLEQGANAQALPRPPARGSAHIFVQTDRTAHSRGAPETQSLTLEIVSTGRALDDITIKAINS